MYKDYLKEVEENQYKTGKVNPDQKTREMGKIAQTESDKYRLSEEEERNLLPNF